jgi:high affinity Mn2+ porin
MACDEAWNRHFHHRVRHSHRHDHKDGHHTHAHADGFNGVHEHLHEHEPVVHSHARPHGVDPEGACQGPGTDLTEPGSPVPGGPVPRGAPDDQSSERGDESMTTRRRAMVRCVTALAAGTLLWGAVPAMAHEGEEDVDLLAGIELEGGVTGILQTTSGNGTNDSTDLTYTVDLTVTGTVSDNGHVIMALEGGGGDGVDGRLGSLSTANYDAMLTDITQLAADNGVGVTDYNVLNISQLFFEGEYMDGSVVVDAGKLDVESYYDTNAYANDETDQFLSAMFTRSAGTSYAELDQYYGPGVAVNASLSDMFDVMALVANGVGSGFNGISDYPYAVLQLDVKPSLGGREGNYRVYGIYDARKYTEISSGETKENVAYGVSLDQALPGNVGVFARYSGQDDKLDENAAKAAWSLGVSLNGAAWGRDDDVAAIGYGVVVVNDGSSAFSGIASPDDEGHIEAYYKLGLSDHFTLTPDVQVITNNGGDSSADTITVAGVRAQLNF